LDDVSSLSPDVDVEHFCVVANGAEFRLVGVLAGRVSVPVGASCARGPLLDGKLVRSVLEGAAVLVGVGRQTDELRIC